MATLSPSAGRPPLPTADASIDDHDTQPVVTRLALAGVAAAIVLALIGGLPFDLPMPTHAFGWVEPSCGLTRGSTAITRGDFALAWRYNPVSFLVMGFGAYGIIRLVAGKLTGRWPTIRLHVGRYGWVLLAVAFVALWAYQQQNADFIIHSRL